MKKILSSLILVIFTFILPNYVLASTNTYKRTVENNYGVTKGYDINDNITYIKSTPLVDASEKIYDFANLYTDEEEEELYEIINSYILKHQIDIVIVTIDSNPKTYSYLPTQNYADDFYDYNDFGYGDDYSGILFLIDMDNREFYISTTGSMMSIINDARVETILTSMDNNMRRGNYYDVTLTFISQTKKYIGYHEHGPTWLWCGLAVLSFIIAIILINHDLKKHKLIKREEKATIYLTDKDIEEKKSNLIKHSVHYVHHTNDGRGFSSSGGGGHIGSSGTSHGGGGHHF